MKALATSAAPSHRPVSLFHHPGKTIVDAPEFCKLPPAMLLPGVVAVAVAVAVVPCPPSPDLPPVPVAVPVESPSPRPDELPGSPSAAVPFA